MLLVHKAQHPTSPSLMPPIKLASTHFHRRNTSAPAHAAPSLFVAAAHVHPTKTPGLLSLSKPQPTRQPAHAAQAGVGLRHPTPRQHKSSPEKQIHSQSQCQTQDKQQRGRASPVKEKSVRNPSKSRAGHGGRVRQPSPTPIPSPPLEQLLNPSTNDDVPKQPRPTSISKATPPVLSSPSGRLAKRRNRPPIPFPTTATAAVPPSSTQPTSVHVKATNVKAKPVPVPQNSLRANHVLPISRSDPVFLSHFPRKVLRRSETDVNVNAFPVCDDNDSEDDEPPSTPTRAKNKAVGAKLDATWQQQRSVFDSDGDDALEQENGPRTAPLSSFASESARRYFPSPAPSPSPLARRRGDVHKRTPSFPTGTMFNSVFDSAASASASASDGELASAQPVDLKAMFHRAMATATPTTTPRSKGPHAHAHGSASVGPAGAGSMYASSTFQNSPSPEHLPPPSFMFAVLKGEVSRLQL